MTKYNDSRNRGIRNADVPISLPNYEQIDSREERYCPYCQLRLSRLIDSSGMNPNWYCSKCVINYSNKSEVKSKSHLSTPQKSNNERPAVSTKFPEYSVSKPPAEIRGSFKTLQSKGMRIKNYKDSVKDN